VPEDVELQEEVSRRLGQPWPEVRAKLERLFGRDWDECEIFISTSAAKKDRTEADVICDLVSKTEEKPPASGIVRRKVVRWIGKPWRERQDPWDRFKDRVPSVEEVRRKRRRPEDLDEWTPYHPKGPEDR
jgi:hypothetical protein